MQHFFQEMQGRLWDFLVRQYDSSVNIISGGWNYLEPFLKNALDFTEIKFNFLKELVSLLSGKSGEIFIFALNYLTLARPAFENLYQKNKYEAWGLIIFTIFVIAFWGSMIRHAKRNELSREKTWIFAMIVLGPIGALIYYVFRKRKIEKQQDSHDKVMMGFFSPMHNNSDVKND